MITQDNIHKHELVGLKARVIDSTNTQLVGITGQVINETKSTLILDTMQSGIKSIPKDINQWRFITAQNQEIHINGAKIAKRSAERLMIKV